MIEKKNSAISNFRKTEVKEEVETKQHNSTLVLILSKSGRGKTTAIRNCDPERTVIVNVMGKQLPFPKANSYVPSENLFNVSSATDVMRVMRAASENGEVDNLIIDDGQYIMATEFMQKASIKGFDKFTQMAKNIWDILILANKLRPGLKVYFLSHEEDGEDRKMKTLGKLLSEKLTPEGMSSVVVYGDIVNEEGGNKYVFTTQSNGVTNAKSPMGMFPLIIPNDIDLMSKRIDEYYKGVELKDSEFKFEVV